MKSMTGMGRAQGEVCGAALRLEIKSVNHRYCEVALRLPSRLSLLEIQIRSYLRSRLSRGKIDLFVTEEKTAVPALADLDAFRRYHEYLRQVAQALGMSADIPLELVLAGAGNWNGAILNLEEVWSGFRTLLDQALLDLDQMRVREGTELKKDISDRLLTIENTKRTIAQLMTDVQAEQEQRIRKSLQERQEELLQLDPARLQMEVLYYLDRLDLSEEIVRLESHLQQLRGFLETSDGEAVGRKVDFMIQEVNREFNTIGSKCQNAAISQHVVLAKAELEKVREQVQNLE